MDYFSAPGKFQPPNLTHPSNCKILTDSSHPSFPLLYEEMAVPASSASQYPPKLHQDVYPFIEPAKFKGALLDKVTVITGTDLRSPPEIVTSFNHV
jgi:hypothetical protein